MSLKEEIDDEIIEEIPIYLGRPKNQELQVWNYATRVRGRNYNPPELISFSSDKESLYFKSQGITEGVQGSMQRNIDGSDALEYTGTLQRQAMHCVYGVLTPIDVKDDSATDGRKKSYILLPINKFYRVTPSVEAGEDLRRFQSHFQLDGNTYLPFQRTDKVESLVSDSNELKTIKRQEKTFENNLDMSNITKTERKSTDLQNQFGQIQFKHVNGHIAIEELLGDENYYQKLKIYQNEANIAPDKYNRLILQTQRIMKPNQKESLDMLIGRLLSSKSIISLQTLFSFTKQHSAQTQALEVAKTFSIPFRGNLAIKKKYLKETERKRNIRDFIIFYFSGFIREKTSIMRIWRVLQWLEDNTIRGQQPSKQLMERLNDILSEERNQDIPGFYCSLNSNVQEVKSEEHEKELQQLLNSADYNEFKEIEEKVIADSEFETKQRGDIHMDREYFLFFAQGCTAAELSDVAYRFNIATLDPETLYFISTHAKDDTYEQEFNQIYLAHLAETQKTIEDSLIEVMQMGPGLGRQIESKAKNMRVVRPYEEGF